MGLDIRAASYLRCVRPEQDEQVFDRLVDFLWEHWSPGEPDPDEKYFLLYPPGQGDASHLAGMKPGLYELTTASEEYRFHAGAYSNYDVWREQLRRFAIWIECEASFEGQSGIVAGPFRELIDYIKCDGWIGSRLASKLAADFRTHAARAEEIAARQDGCEGFIYNYRDFARGFELAAQDGALVFC